MNPKRKKHLIVYYTMKEVNMSFEFLEKYHELMFVDQIAEALDTPKSTVYQWIRKEKIQAVRIGRFYRVPKSSLIAFLQKSVA